ncbi:RICIN domain-containing protein [Acetobacterium bakii]|uniref:RICIN domain-containing protein n=1 Tax=Acetobacterium bakii TaxID=52689 RepID=UPI001364DE46|nr:RICIN domain-containing protein [Acetobacterium bakii]
MNLVTPRSRSFEHISQLASLILGKTYFIRQKTSGKYLDVTGGIDANGTNVCQFTFNGSNGQKWKVLDGKQGYIVLQPACAQTRVLDIYGGVDAEGANAAIYEKNGSEAQRFKLKVLSDGSYQIAAKCAGDKKVLTNFGSYTAAGTNIDIRGIVGENLSQSWYFEPVETGVDVSDPPTNGNTYFMRTRHSGQYWDVSYKATANDSPVVQYYLNRGDNQRYRLELLEESEGIKYFYIRPLHALNKVLKINSANQLVLSDPVNDDRQKFAFTQNATNKTYRLTIKAPNGGFNTLGVAAGSYSGGAALDVYTDQQAETQQFILEAISDTMGAQLTYTDDKSRVKTLTDTNGKVSTFNYDANNQQLLSIAEPGNRLTQYAYEAQTQHLLSVGTKMEDSTLAQVQFGYEMNRIAKITRNGFDYDFAYDAFGNVTTIKVGGSTYLTNDYEPNNGNLKKTTFANGAVVENSRDKMGRLISQNATPPGTGRCQFRTVSDTMGNAIREIDATTGRLFEYEYDLIGRLIGIERTGSEATIKKQQLRRAYDTKNRVDYLTGIVDGVATKTQYVYGDGLSAGSLSELIYQVMVNDTKRVECSYDNLARGYTRKLNTAVPFTTTYQIKKGTAPGTTTTLVESITNGASTLSYTYDVFGNILTVKENGSLKITYVYDMRNQLVSETNQYLRKEISYTYDTGGNCLTKKETLLDSPYTVTTISYGYDTIWKDKLTSYLGLPIVSDANGNPTSYYNGLAFNWEKARELGSITKGGVTTTYQYTASGIRLEKDTAGVKTQFYLNGSQIMTQISGIDRFDFYYDEAGLLFGFRYNANDYYYIRNIQNDIIGIVDAEGKVVVNYCYDSWGKLISITGDYKDTVGLKNSFRYRGYYYDNESGFYYLNSRYYDPETGRFINPDIIMGVGDKDPMAYNLFVYCNNNPVNRQDPSGRSLSDLWNWIKSTVKTILKMINNVFEQQQKNGQGQIHNPFNGEISGGGGGGNSGNAAARSADIGRDVFEGGTSESIDTALEFAIAPISPQITVKSFSKGLKVGPIAAMFYANDIRLNYEQYAGNNDNIAIANWIDTAVLVAGVGVGALLATSALPIIAVVTSAVVIALLLDGLQIS